LKAQQQRQSGHTRQAGSVVFSFFKKEPKDADASPAKGGSGRSSRPAGRPLPQPVNRNASVTLPKPANTEGTVPDKDLHRTLAMETAAKTTIESGDGARD
jgi:hypothetical protein